MTMHLFTNLVLLRLQFVIASSRNLITPPYSPDIAPSDYYLFSNLKRHLRGRIFGDDLELKEAVEEWFESKDSTFYKNGILSLCDRWSRVIHVKVQYIE